MNSFFFDSANSIKWFSWRKSFLPGVQITDFSHVRSTFSPARSCALLNRFLTYLAFAFRSMANVPSLRCFVWLIAVIVNQQECLFDTTCENRFMIAFFLFFSLNWNVLLVGMNLQGKLDEIERGLIIFLSRVPGYIIHVSNGNKIKITRKPRTNFRLHSHTKLRNMKFF